MSMTGGARDAAAAAAAAVTVATTAADTAAHCHHCGAAFVRPTAKFCGKCGTKKANNNSNSNNNDVGSSGMANNTTSVPPPHVRNTVAPQRPTSTTTTRAVTTTNNSSSDKSNTHNTNVAAAAAVAHLNDNNNSGSAAETMAAATSMNGTSASDDATATAHTIHATPEEEAQYTAWATLRPQDLTPEMLQTANAEELRAWRKGGLIGRGTYGSVHLGLLPDGSFYAVKCVELSAAGASGNSNNIVAAAGLHVQELVTLSREIRLMQRLTHRNVCRFKGVYYDASSACVCLFMEYVSGGSLASLVRRLRPLPPSVVRAWTRQLLSGLLYLHAQHILHRDIKGDNVLVDLAASPSSRAQIKLADFGAARRLGDAATRSRTVIGTPYWMAPEVVTASAAGVGGNGNSSVSSSGGGDSASPSSAGVHDGDKGSSSSSGSEGGYSYKADVWSVGCTVAEMLTGKPPWTCCANAPAAICMIASSTGMPNAVPFAEATEGCAHFMRQCFIRNPDERPTVEQLLQHPWIVGDME